MRIQGKEVYFIDREEILAAIQRDRTRHLGPDSDWSDLRQLYHALRIRCGKLGMLAARQFKFQRSMSRRASSRE